MPRYFTPALATATLFAFALSASGADVTEEQRFKRYRGTWKLDPALTKHFGGEGPDSISIRVDAAEAKKMLAAMSLADRAKEFEKDAYAWGVITFERKGEKKEAPFFCREHQPTATIVYFEKRAANERLEPQVYISLILPMAKEKPNDLLFAGTPSVGKDLGHTSKVNYAVYRRAK